MNLHHKVFTCRKATILQDLQKLYDRNIGCLIVVIPFWKVVLGEPIAFDDLIYIFDCQTMNKYEQLKFIDALLHELDFTIRDGNSTDEHIKNGKDIMVTSENVDDYLLKLANYWLKDKYKKVYDVFREGMFETIKNKEVFLNYNQFLLKWLTSEFMYILNIGD